MKRGWIVLLVTVGLAWPLASHAQVSAYAEFSVTSMKSAPKGDVFYGATTGVLIDGPKIFHAVVVSADLQGRFVGKDGQRMDGATIGPRFSIPMRAKLTPFAEFLVGFARFNDGSGHSSTDQTFQINGGVSRQLTPRLDAVLDYSYAQFGYNAGQFNPKTFSIGAVYHFVKR